MPHKGDRETEPSRKIERAPAIAQGFEERALPGAVGIGRPFMQIDQDKSGDFKTTLELHDTRHTTHEHYPFTDGRVTGRAAEVSRMPGTSQRPSGRMIL